MRNNPRFVAPAAARTRRLGATVAFFVLAAGFLSPIAAHAQDQQTEQQTRAGRIEQERREKQAVLWPERTSPIAEIANGFVERGLLDGVESGLGGGNGPQLVLGGMRSGQGMSVGVGYRRSDLFDDRVGFRSTVRGSLPQAAFMVDTQLYFPSLYTERGFLDIYTKLEHSPEMDYYGEGPGTRLEDRASYTLDDVRLEARGGWEFFDYLRIGGAAGAILVQTDSGRRSGVPSIEETFDPTIVPGLFIDGEFMTTSVFVQADWRDNRGGPRYGGNYLVEWKQYWDLTSPDKFNFREVTGRIDQYFPYFNKTRVVAIHIHGVYTFVEDGDEVPFYLQPTLGGNDDLRSYQRYRFYANNAFHANVEHRWHGFAGMDVALFFDVGKVANNARLLYREDLEYGGGIGFRFKMRETVIMRIDQAYGREGYRFMWTFNNIF